MDQQIWNTLRDTIKNSRHLVILLGMSTTYDNGLPDHRDSDAGYEIEVKYGYSQEEIFNGAFYNTRPETFFCFYRDDMLKQMKEPNELFHAMAELEQRGILKCTITRSVYGLTNIAGCRNVIELLGSVYENKCPKCGRGYPMEYIRDSQKVPLCPDCNAVIRPQVTLFGEQVDNSKITKAAEEVRKSDTLLVIGCALDSELCKNVLNYFDGDKLILIHEVAHKSDHFANLVIHEKPKDVLPQIVRELLC